MRWYHGQLRWKLTTRVIVIIPRGQGIENYPRLSIEMKLSISRISITLHVQPETRGGLLELNHAIEPTVCRGSDYRRSWIRSGSVQIKDFHVRPRFSSWSQTSFGHWNYHEYRRSPIRQNIVQSSQKKFGKHIFNTRVCVNLLNWLVSRARSIHRTIDRWRYLSPFF